MDTTNQQKILLIGMIIAFASIFSMISFDSASAQESNSVYVKLDKQIYTWTDKVYITISAPEYNLDSNLVEEIGDSDLYPVKVTTRGYNLDQYKLVETGTDTGIFTGEVILTGFTHDSDGDTTTGDSNGNDVVFSAASGTGPTDGLLPTDDDDGLVVSFEFSEDKTVVGSALIRWNIGEVQWLEANYPSDGVGHVRIIDPDMNLDPEAFDYFDIDVWSHSDAAGIDLTMTETNIATGIFEGTVFFSTTDESSGHRLRVSEGDTITAEYEDNTLPDPYTTADERDIVATSLIDIVTIDESDDDTLDDIIPVDDVAFTGGDTSAGDSETMFIMIAGIAIIITVIGIIIWFRKMKNSTMIKE